jgi:hypothetical protein
VEYSIGVPEEAPGKMAAARTSFAATFKHGIANAATRKDTPNSPTSSGSSVDLTSCQSFSSKHSLFCSKQRNLATGRFSELPSRSSSPHKTFSLRTKAFCDVSPLLEHSSGLRLWRNASKVSASAATAGSPMDQGEKAGNAWLKKLMGANAPPASDIVWAALGKLSF